jgi:hypothetical protein
MLPTSFRAVRPDFITSEHLHIRNPSRASVELMVMLCRACLFSWRGSMPVVKELAQNPLHILTEVSG